MYSFKLVKATFRQIFSTYALKADDDTCPLGKKGYWGITGRHWYYFEYRYLCSECPYGISFCVNGNGFDQWVLCSAEKKVTAKNLKLRKE